jgi:predicted metal-dependent hydrolase
MLLNTSPSDQMLLPSGASIATRFVMRRGMKRMTLKLDPVRRIVVVCAPSRTAKRDMVSFAQANGAWLQARLDALPPVSLLVEGGTFLLRGRPTLLVRKDGRGGAVYHDGEVPTLSVAASPDRLSARTMVALKAMAQSDALGFVEALQARLGKAPRSIRLRDTKSRWGSCTTQGDIMLSWRLIGAPPKVFEYVVAHEMAHLMEMNHSAAFWAHVTALMPDWKPARAWLKANGTKLHALGA